MQEVSDTHALNDYILDSLTEDVVICRYDKFLVPGTSAAQLFLYDPEG